MKINIKETFDTSTALSNMYLWLLFGYLSTLLNCDLQRFMNSHILVRHVIGITTFFFLFTLIDTENKTNILSIWVKTLVVYILFILSTKAKWFFVLPVLALLLIDQTIKKHVSIEKTQERITEEGEMKFKDVSRFLNVVVTSCIVTGVIHYAFLQKAEYGSKFSWWTFFLGKKGKCKDYTENMFDIDIMPVPVAKK